MRQPAQRKRRCTGRAEVVAGLALLVLLGGIGLAVYLVGRGPAAQGADLAGLLPRPEANSQFEIAVAARQWPADRMHEKIDGEDAVYLKAGCRALAAMALSGRGAPSDTIDLFLYEMSSPAAAEKVFADQAPDEDAIDPADRPAYVQIGDKAYTCHGSCFLRTGPYYLKVINNGESAAAAAEVLRLARRFAARVEDLP